MKIVVAGDSHSYGTELVPERFRNKSAAWFVDGIPAEHQAEAAEYRKARAWPRILANGFGLSDSDLINLSAPGVGNHLITMQILDWLSNAGPHDANSSLVLIGWSNPERLDVWSESTQRWSSLFPLLPKLNNISEFYFKHIQSYKESYQRYFTQMIMMQNILEKHGVRCLMFNAIVSPFGIGKIFEDFRPFIDLSRIYPESMTDVCIKHNCARAPGYHFLEQGHQLWANKMTEFVRTTYPDFN